MGCIIINPGEVWLDADEPDCNKDTIIIMYDSNYDSKMHEVIIPLMGFNGFHHASSTDSKEEFEDFIGRESIIDKLKGWLYDAREDNRRHKTKYSGAYLITGFRGMGKSSFVHKAIHEIQTKKPTKKKYVPISINVGNDLLTSRELLYIICRLLNKSYDDNTRIDTKLTADSLYHKTLYFIKRLLRFIKNLFTFKWKEAWRSIDYFLCSNFIQLVFLALFGLMFHLFSTSHGTMTLIQDLEQLAESFIGFFSYLYHLVISTWQNSPNGDDVLNGLKKLFSWKDVVIFIALLTCCFIKRIFFFFYELTGSSIFITKWQIRRNFKHILQRIESDTTITTQNGVEGQMESKMDTESVKWGFERFKNKKIFYPIAQTTEIQDLLVDQLSLINRMPSSNLRFIFIIDELDKVSPEDLETQTIPEYEYTNSVKGNSTYRSRQKALAEMLANLKYFISSSEAKFIFITGYDMYEATLSDISSREFNIHSIFNGYINVSSFLRKTGKDSGADSMIEEYFCHMLLSKNVKKKTSNCKDLSDYASFYRERWDASNSKDFEENDRPLFEMLLERRINFLRHFLTYLFYMSNGSPKKLAMYLEKYIRSKDRVHEQIKLRHPGKEKENQELKQLRLGVKESWDKCNWFLFFDARNMQKIEFVNYLIYPMIKNLIAKSSIYNDKLLVATSFMISNLYKFHKSGFSWRNLEYMPELLEINKMPELRDFIGGIMQFLNQTHIDEATLNLYKFKFPQRLSEEITFFSKSSEEVSFLFNFSHDELLSIKKLYHQQLKHYKGMQNEAPAIASIHHTLGDIYMLEENYEQAIYEFNEGLNAIFRQDGASQSNMEDATNVLFRIRVSLKLALAYEKRKTFDTAYNTYLNIEKLILAIVDAPSRHFGSQITEELRNNSSFFTNVRITILCILAKVAVLEKMGMGGIRIKDLEVLNNVFNSILTWLKDDEIRPVLIIEFYKKLGDILYYKNGVFANNGTSGSQTFSHIVESFRNQVGLNDYLGEKFKYCQRFIDDQKQKGEKTINPPCLACQCFNKSICGCIEELNGVSKNYKEESRSLFFIELLFNVEGCQDVMRKGNVFMLTMANLLVGMGNTLLGCIKKVPTDISIQNFFLALDGFFRKGYNDVSFDAIDQLKHKNVMNPYSKAILYYLAAAKTYELLTDYKSAYNIYIQILDAVFAYSRAVSYDIIDKYSLRFCKVITEQAITCTYLHYDCINCEEIDTIKHEMGKKQSEHINLHNLSSFPEIEVVTEKYYRLCLLCKPDVRNQTLKNVINSRQLGQNKLIATLTQNIQNMYFKVVINDELLSMMIPDVTRAFSGYHHSLIKTLECFSEYYNSFNLKELVDSLEWKILKNDNPTKNDKMDVLFYLVKDTLFCLNKITELIAPLFSTTLYSNAYIGLIYEKIFNWSHLWITLREISEYGGNKDKAKYIENFKKRYLAKDDEYYVRLVRLFDSFNNLQLNINRDNENNKDKNSDSHAHEINFLTGSYLTGNAIDFFNRSIEMHTSGKAYKEMMPTLFFLEDDLNNDSNYLNLAIERFLLNHGYIQDKMDNLKKYSFAKSSLLRSENYHKP